MRKLKVLLTTLLCVVSVAAICFAFSACSTVNVESVSLDKTEISMTIGDEQTLNATVKPENATNKQVTWSSSDETVATVTNGKVEAKAEGSAVITVKTNDGGKTATCNVTVNPAVVHVTGVTIKDSSKSISLEVGDEGVKIDYDVAPSNATNKKVTWSSSNKQAVEVDDEGKVTPVAEGTSTITITTEDGSKTDTCTVTVSPKRIAVTEVTLDKDSLDLVIGWNSEDHKDTAQLTAHVLPEEASDKSVVWSSSSPQSVSVDQTGKVTAVEECASVTITVTTVDGDHTATCQVTVTKHTHTPAGSGIYTPVDDDVCSTTCSECDATYNVPHEFGDYIVDEAAGTHYKKCEHCDRETTHDQHTLGAYKTESGKHTANCLVCEHQITESCSYVTVPAGNGRQHKEQCSVCKVDSTKPWVDCTKGESPVYKEDITATQHIFLCSVCQQECPENHAPNSWKENSDHQHYLQCSICNKTFNCDVQNAVLDKESSTGTVHHYKCTCGYDKMEAHKWEAVPEGTDELGHTLKCSVCDYSSAKQNHTKVWHADEEKDGHYFTCSVQGCNYESAHTSHDGSDKWVTKEEDTANHYHLCSVCSTYYAQTAHGGSDKWVEKDGDTDNHYHYCGDCSTYYDQTAHTGTTIAKKDDDREFHYCQCTDCNGLYNPVKHTITYSEIQEETHKSTCNECGLSFTEPHNQDGEGGKCTCGGGKAAHVHQLKVDANGYYDGSCTDCGENLFFTVASFDSTLIVSFTIPAEYQEKVTKVTIPEKINNNNIVGFGGSLKTSSTSPVFKNSVAAKVTHYLIPESVTKVGTNLFGGNSVVQAVIFKANITKLPAGVFAKCTALNYIVLSDSITEIDTKAIAMTATDTSTLKNIYYLGADWAKVTVGDISKQWITTKEVKVYTYSEAGEGQQDKWHWDVTDKLLPVPWVENKESVQA